MNRLALILLVGILAPLAAQAAPEPGPFTDFAGSYRGTARVLLIYPGKSHMNFVVPPNGNSGVLTVKATVNSGGNLFDVSNTFRFTKKTFSAARLAPPSTEVPTPRGRLSASHAVLRGSAQLDPNILVTIKATLRKSRKVAALEVDYKAYSSGVLAYQVTYKGSRKVKPE